MRAGEVAQVLRAVDHRVPHHQVPHPQLAAHGGQRGERRAQAQADQDQARAAGLAPQFGGRRHDVIEPVGQAEFGAIAGGVAGPGVVEAQRRVAAAIEAPGEHAIGPVRARRLLAEGIAQQHGRAAAMQARRVVQSSEEEAPIRGEIPDRHLGWP